MQEDPIVREVRDAGEALARQAGGDMHAFFEILRAAQSRHPDRVVRGPHPEAESAISRKRIREGEKT